MAKGDSKLLTQADYARSRAARGLPGGTREAVRKAIEAGDISAFGPKKLIDQELADAQWARNRRARISPQAAAAGGPDLADQGSAPPAANDAPPPAQPADTGYTAARARREQAEAEQAEIQLAKLRGELVEREGVDRAGFEVGRDLRDALESSVNGLAAELAAAGNADRCAEVLRQHNRAVCDVLVKSWREKMGGTLRLEAA
jgi:hypothetical protein